MNDESGASALAANAAANIPLTEEVRLLVANARTLAEAEFAYQRARAKYAGAKVRSIAVLAAIAALFGFFALMAAVIGTVIALGPVLGLWGAMAAVTTGLLLIVAVCGILIVAHVRRMKAVLSEESGDGKAG